MRTAQAYSYRWRSLLLCIWRCFCWSYYHPHLRPTDVATRCVSPIFRTLGATIFGRLMRGLPPRPFRRWQPVLVWRCCLSCLLRCRRFQIRPFEDVDYPPDNLIARWQAVFDHVDRFRIGMVVLERYPSAAACLAKPGELQVMINCH